MKIFKKLFTKIFTSGSEQEKRLATINNEPWVKVIEVSMTDPNDPTKGNFELDWNNLFIESLYEAGYSGRSDVEVIDQWFNDLCRGIIANDLAE